MKRSNTAPRNKDKNCAGRVILNSMGFFVRLFAVVLVVAGATLFAQWQTQQLFQKQDTEASLVAQDTATMRVRIGNSSLNVEVADTDAERVQGLSGRVALAENAGMLFIFDAPALYNFWMPNMSFPIDIIWINESRRIIGFEKNAAPLEVGKDAVFYSPPSPIKYALEANAGFVEKNNITAGQQIDFE